jgi:hypothetical protein
MSDEPKPPDETPETQPETLPDKPLVKKTPEELMEIRMRNLRGSMFKKGQSGNPEGGRRHAKFRIRPIVRKVLEGTIDDETGKRAVEEVAEALVEQAKKGNVRAIEVLLDRFDGPLTQKHDIKQHGDVNVTARIAAFQARINRVCAGRDDRPDDPG